MQIHTSAQEAKKKNKNTNKWTSAVLQEGTFQLFSFYLWIQKNPLIFIHSVLSMVLVVSSDQC